jgi:hypothetical protein
MPQIQRVPDQPDRGTVRDPQHTTEFGWGEVRDCGGALPAEPDRMLRAGQPTFGYTVAGVQVGPMSCDLKSSGFGGDQGVFVGLRGCQCSLRRLARQDRFEHTFNIRRRTDNLPAIRKGHQIDNTSPMQTTPAGEGANQCLVCRLGAPSDPAVGAGDLGERSPPIMRQLHA